jgi:hypothetical protein
MRGECLMPGNNHNLRLKCKESNVHGHCAHLYAKDCELKLGERGVSYIVVHCCFFTEVRGTCRKQLCLFWLPRAVHFKVSCSQIPLRTFAGIRTHDPLVESPTSYQYSATTLHTLYWNIHWKSMNLLLQSWNETRIIICHVLSIRSENLV